MTPEETVTAALEACGSVDELLDGIPDLLERARVAAWVSARVEWRRNECIRAAWEDRQAGLTPASLATAIDATTPAVVKALGRVGERRPS